MSASGYPADKGQNDVFFEAVSFEFDHVGNLAVLVWVNILRKPHCGLATC